MSTLRPIARSALLLGLATACAGCSSLPRGRPGKVAAANPNLKTYLAVGEKPMPVVTGEPGASLAADERAPSASRVGFLRHRVSGRVYDHEGAPVPGARVRLAVGGAAGGRDVQAVTDPSGAFTLRGLRPGSTYTVIADWDSNEGPMTGRAEATTADTGLKITLAHRDASSTDSNAAPKVNRVSDRTETDESEEPPTELEPEPSVPSESERPAPAINEEDLPPAVEADALPGAERTGRGAGGGTVSWRRGSGARLTPAPESVEPAATAAPAPFLDPDARGTGADAAESPAAFDEGPNPLPPALEPDAEPSARNEPPAEIEPLTPSRGGGLASRDLESEPPAALAQSKAAGVSRFESPSRPTAQPPRSKVVDRLPGAVAMVPETYSPVVLPDNTFTTDVPNPTRGPAIPPRQPAPPAPPRAEPARANAPDREVSRPFRRPTWGDVSLSSGALPPLEGEGESGPQAAPEVARRDVPELVPDWALDPKPVDGPANPVRDGDRSTSRAERPLKDETTALCKYDDRHRRILDFRLPDLQGRPVRFHDIDADLILLDFWGTWCGPCLKSIPRLVSLQKEHPGKTLAVIGIACESGSPEEAASAVSATAQRLKVNYPILLSRNDGSCPLQQALHVQAFPTLVLIDREGRVVWRDQGATPATLSRLARVLDTVADAGAKSRTR